MRLDGSAVAAFCPVKRLQNRGTTVNSKVEVLGAPFAATDRPSWVSLVEKTLGGASFEAKLLSRTPEGLQIQPLYGPADAGLGLEPGLRSRRSFDAHRPWDIRALVDHPDPEQARLQALEDLEGGASSLIVRIDPTAVDGLAAASAADLEHALSGVLFDLAPVALDAGYLGVTAAKWLSEIANARTLRPRLMLHLDPISAYATQGDAPGPIESHIRYAAEAAGRIDAETAFLASGRSVHEAGGGEAEELAFMAASGLAYLKAQTAAGASLPEALSRTALGICVDAEYFTSIAKLRAARAIWMRIAAAAGAQPQPARIEARSSRRMLAALDPWVNMLRLTAACFAGGVGGADAVALDAFTQPIGRPTAFARRQRRNIQLVLMEEAHVGRVADPSGGSFFLEALTRDLASAAWTAFQEIERRGGVIPSLSGGHTAERVQAVRAERHDLAARRRVGMVGVSEFPALGQAPVEVASIDAARYAKPTPQIELPGASSHCPPLTPWRPSSLFETLRIRAEGLTPPPLAYLAVVGSIRDAAGRIGFMTNALAAGGIAARSGPVEAFDAHETPVAILCGSDAAYSEASAASARALLSAGAKRVYLAGRPGGLAAELGDAGVSGFIFAGADLPKELSAILNVFEGEA